MAVRVGIIGSQFVANLHAEALKMVPEAEAGAAASAHEEHVSARAPPGAGKIVVGAKPMAMNLEECDRMIEACRPAGVHLLYAEELLFAPKYVRAKTLAEEGALGAGHPARRH